jgi:DNA-directed RNA polymerase subunit RPC12/RpoP
MTHALICSDCGKPLKPNRRRLGTRCKPCGARAMAQSPEKREKCRIAMKRRFDEPGYRQQHVSRCTAGTRRALKDNPEFRAMRAEQGRRVGLSRTGHSANKAGHPSRVAAGIKRSATVLAWCPVEYRDEYRRLVRTKLIRAPEARRMVEHMIAADLARYAATGVLPQSARVQGDAG